MINKDLGLVTAYAYAVSKGYTGTEDEFAELMASYASVAEQAEESAGDSEAWAIGKRDGQDVPSTDETYHNNSKYYAGQAGTSASTAASSASAASASESNAAASASSAAGSASSATTSAATATEKAGEASTSASEASASAASAAGSATNAASSATAASASATAAGNAQTAAETAQGKAEDAQEAAEQAQSDAEAAAQSVSQSAAQISQNTSDISDLKSALNVAYDVLENGAWNMLPYATFVRAGMSNGTLTSYTNRVATNDIISFPVDITLKADTGFRFGLHYFIGNTYTGESGWQTELDVPAGTRYKMVISRVVEIVEMADIQQFVTAIYVINGFHEINKDITSIEHDFDFAEYSIDDAFKQIGIVKAEFVGTCTQTTVDGKLINNPTQSLYGDVRLVYKVKVEADQEVIVDITNVWIPQTFDFEVTVTNDEDYKKTGIIASVTYTDENGTVVTRAFSSGFQKALASGGLKIKSLYSGLVYLAIRYPVNNVHDGFYSGVAYVRAYTETQKIEYPLSGNIPRVSCIHRGWATAPNNTAQSFYSAYKNGYTLCECDVRMTSDNVPVLAHDATITGTVDGVTTTYTVADETLATLKELILPSDNYSDARITTLEEAIKLAVITGCRYLLDMKQHDVYEQTMNIIEQYDFVDNIIFNTNGSIANANYLVGRNNRVNLLFAINSYSDAENYESFIDREGKTFISFSIADIPNTITHDQYKLISQKGFYTGLWNVSNTTFATALSLYPSFIEYTDATKSAYDWVALGEQYYETFLGSLPVVV